MKRTIVLTLLVLLGCQFSMAGKKNSLRIVTYNVGAFSKYMENSAPFVAAMLEELNAGVVGLNELDSMNIRHPKNQVEELAFLMGGWNWKFGKAMDYRNGGFGNGVITPDEILSSYTVVLEKGSGMEQRSMAVVETDRYIFGAAHLDHKSADARMMQVKQINEWANSLSGDKPIFFAGDMNANPDSETLALIQDSWDLLSCTVNTFPSRNPVKCIDYIFHFKKSCPVKVKGSDVPTEFIVGDVQQTSDHLPIYVDVVWK